MTVMWILLHFLARVMGAHGEREADGTPRDAEDGRACDGWTGRRGRRGGCDWVVRAEAVGSGRTWDVLRR